MNAYRAKDWPRKGAKILVRMKPPIALISAREILAGPGDFAFFRG
ncbi:hypothetical protein OPIT5_16515 [Opitutaceae bacterium TAV5]|nr:hypothetical protein OPIT5_16515 [Opitutaceae bacterium TAV5]